MNGGRKEDNLDTKKRKEVQTLFERSVCLWGPDKHHPSCKKMRRSGIENAMLSHRTRDETQKMEKNDEKDFIFRRVEKGREDTAWIYVS